MMNKLSTKNVLRGILLPLFLIAVDQLTKMIAVQKLKGGQHRDLIRGVLGLSYIENRGMSFGLLQGQRWLFVVITVLVCLFLIFLYTRIPETKRFRPLAVSVLFLAGVIVLKHFGL